MSRVLPRASYLLLLVAVLCLATSTAAGENDGWRNLFTDDMSAWRAPTRGWQWVGGVHPDTANPRRLAATSGGGVLVNGPNGRAENLVTKDQFRDLELHVEFLVPKGSNSGVKFHGQYEIQILDSWGVEKPTASDCGGIYPRAELQPRYHLLDEGVPPRTNAARRPGEWQTLDAIFQSPRFDSAGKKTANARFVKVVLNGKVIHEDVEVPTPTGHAWHDKESPAGPLLLQGDHGPVAFRNLRIRPLASERVSE